MNRRETLFALVALGAVPVTSFAQHGKVWRVGFLAPRRVGPLDADPYGGFPRGMRELGYVEGKNLVIDWRSAEGDSGRLPALAAELVRLKADVIVAVGTQSVGAAQKATTDIPIVMGGVADPLGSGFVRSLSRPGGNITGLSNLAGDVGGKHVELLISILPKLTRIAVLTNPTNSSHAAILKSIQAVAKTARVDVVPLEARTPEQIEKAFATMSEANAGAVIVALDALFNQQQRQITALAAKHRLPSAFGVRDSVEAGGLMSYGQNLAESYRRAASYVDKILKGAKAGDLPVEQATQLELVLNLKTAKALGITIPPPVLLRAERVIQ
jgi:putative ABC transport system substrate-binding protein